MEYNYPKLCPKCADDGYKSYYNCFDCRYINQAERLMPHKTFWQDELEICRAHGEEGPGIVIGSGLWLWKCL
jgi:hypothetical protein